LPRGSRSPLTYALSLAVVGASLASQARVSVVKGFLILAAALVVAAQIVYRLLNPTVPLFETMGIIGLVNLGFNVICLWLLTPYRRGDVNMASAWECSRNDIYEGTAVLAAAGAVWIFDAGWPDLVVATGLLALFLKSAISVLRRSFAALHEAKEHGPGPGKVQDPVCKCWIDPKTAAATITRARQTYYFCDAGCKAKFEALA
jgi:Co/Zn/Cd efflux system component